MEKGSIVFVPCTFQRGGFPSERLFILRSPGHAELRGVADVNYCYDESDRPLGDEPPQGEEIRGRLIGVVVRVSGDSTVRVHLPDGEVYDLDRNKLVPAREANPRHVPV